MTTTTAARQDFLALPYVATTEAKAEMFAEAIEVLFGHCVETEVFEDGDKWGIAVVKGANHIGDPIKNERVATAHILVMIFDLAEGHGDIYCIAELLCDIPPTQKTLTKRARRAFRIEEKLDRILAALDGGKATAAGRSITVIQNDGTQATPLTEKITVANTDGNQGILLLTPFGDNIVTGG